MIPDEVDRLTTLGELRHIAKLRFWPLTSVLKEKYLMEPDEAELLASFLIPMLHYYPDSRATAAELVHHPWLDNVVVQGEIEIAEKLHNKEIERLDSVGKKGGSGEDAQNALDLGPAVQGLAGMGRI